MDIPVLVNIAVYAIVGIYALSGVLLGIHRGFGRETVRFIFAGVAFGLSYALFSAAYPWLYSFLEGKTLADVASMYDFGIGEDMMKYAECVDGDIALYIASIPFALAIFPLGFLFVFLTITGLLQFPFVALCGALGFEPQYNTPLTRGLGAGVGLVHGVLIGLLMIMPVGGVLSVATEAITLAEENHPDSPNTIAISNSFHSYLDGVEDNPAIKYSNDSFGYIYDKFSTIIVEGEEINVRELSDDLFELFVLYGDLGEDFDFKKLTPENKQTINDMIECFKRDHMMTAIVSGAVSSIGKAITTGAFETSIDEPMNTLFMTFMEICVSCDSETVSGDVRTLTDIYFLFSDKNLLSSGTIEGMFDSFTSVEEDGTTTFNRMVTILRANPRFSKMADTYSKVAMDLLLQNSDMDKETQETITEVKDTLTDIIKINKDDFETEEEYKAEVNKTLDETLKNNNIDLEEEEMNQLTDFVIENFGNTDKEEISDEEFLDFMLQYYDIYAKGGLGSIPGIDNPGNTDPEGGDPEGTDPEGTDPEGGIPEGGIPEGGIPEDLIPEGGIPEDLIP